MPNQIEESLKQFKAARTQLGQAMSNVGLESTESMSNWLMLQTAVVKFELGLEDDDLTPQQMSRFITTMDATRGPVVEEVKYVFASRDVQLSEVHQSYFSDFEATSKALVEACKSQSLSAENKSEFRRN